MVYKQGEKIGIFKDAPGDIAPPIPAPIPPPPPGPGPSDEIQGYHCLDCKTVLEKRQPRCPGCKEKIDWSSLDQ